MTKRPNIIILNPDQMRADSMHHLGNEASVTPVLDALAPRGNIVLKGILPEPGLYPVEMQLYEWLVSTCGRTPHYDTHDASGRTGSAERIEG